MKVVTNNSFIRARNKVDEAWSGIDVQLKRRHDLVPNLVDTVKGYAAHESATLAAVTQARSAAMTAAAEELLARGVRHLDVHRASERLAGKYGRWPLSDAPLGTIIEDGGRPRIGLRERDALDALVDRGGQLMAAPPPGAAVRVHLHH